MENDYYNKDKTPSYKWAFIGSIAIILLLAYLLIFTPKNCPEFKPTNSKPLEPIKIDSTVIKTLEAKVTTLTNKVNYLTFKLNQLKKHENTIVNRGVNPPSIFIEWSDYCK